MQLTCNNRGDWFWTDDSCEHNTFTIFNLQNYMAFSTHIYVSLNTMPRMKTSVLSRPTATSLSYHISREGCNHRPDPAPHRCHAETKVAQIGWVEFWCIQHHGTECCCHAELTHHIQCDDQWNQVVSRVWRGQVLN